MTKPARCGTFVCQPGSRGAREVSGCASAAKPVDSRANAHHGRATKFGPRRPGADGAPLDPARARARHRRVAEDRGSLDQRESHLGAIDAVRLARHAYPIDRDFEAELVAHGGQTLVSAGLEAPPAPPPPVPPALPVVLPPPAPSPEVLAAIVDGIVCSVAEAADTSPRAVRASVLLVLRRALEVRLVPPARSRVLDAADGVTQALERGSPVNA